MESENRAPGERPMSPGANVDLPLANPGITTAPAAYSAICNTLAMVQSQIKVLGRAILDDQDQSIELSRQRKSMTVKVIELAEEKIKTVERFNAVLDQVAILRQSKNTEAEELMAEAERQIALQWEKFNLEKEAAETKFQENTSKIENDLAELNRLRAEVQQTTAEREEFKELQRNLENAENAFKEQDVILKHNQRVYAQNLKKDAIIENNQRVSAQLLNEKNDALCQLKEVTLSDTKLKEKVVELEEKLQNMSVGSLEEEILRSKLQEAEKFKREWDDFMSRPQKTVDKNGVVRSSVVPNLKARKREVLEILRRSHPNDPILAVYISRLDDAQKSEYLPFDCFRNYSDPKIQEIAILGRNKKKPVSVSVA
ncbi:hypothetical protein DL95DRAFT_99170 [Leptodontidium sp. 2 PMI_412]|nr:hypothetical protein DL95DRAFT_99170 [Leptodontidium sp. 2 PMI_412]